MTVLFNGMVLPFLLYQILGKAYGLAKAIYSSVPVFSLLHILALHTCVHGTKPRISHMFINISQLIQQYNRITGVTPAPSYVPTQTKRRSPKTKIFT